MKIGVKDLPGIFSFLRLDFRLLTPHRLFPRMHPNSGWSVPVACAGL